MSHEPYRELARTFGLAMRPWEPSITTAAILLDGVVDGQRVHVRRTIGRHPRVMFRATLQPALDLGLVVRRAGLVAAVEGMLGAVDVELGAPRFDASFAVRADEPDRARALLGRAVRDVLIAVDDDPIEVRDDEVTIDVALDGPWSHAPRSADQHGAWLAASTRRVAAVAAALDAARAATAPASRVVPLVPALEAIAARHGLVCAADAPARVSGTIGGAFAWAATRRRARGSSELEVAARVPTPVPFHLVIATARTGLGAWLTGGDVPLGDAAFDAAFDVRTDDPERLRALLDPSLRAAVIAIGAGRRLELDRWGVRVVEATADVDPATLPVLLEQVAELAAALSRGGAPARGYR